MLQAKNITKTYDSQVLAGIDVDIPQEQFVAIMGPSGSGKSTLLHILSGLDCPTGGSVQLKGTEITALTDQQRAQFRLQNIGFVFQQPHFLPSISVRDNIILPGFLAAKRQRQEVTQLANGLLERMGIGELGDRAISEVSGGQLQRAGICRALINEPAIIFGDEPTGALNHATSVQILSLLHDIHGAGTTIILVTHDPLVASHAQRVLVLADGQIAEDVWLGTYDPASESMRLETVMAVMARQGV
ncbi:ABC-type antimicrobial peptide transport system, ATPase component [Corynebacterium mustelae]|uniref:ABC-type antimicrobial peptide transport system, ATPase component n=1 Tax=Corynebacterium mustelae TaxID=571915 RepID=A0A0G3H7X5_9CORY|nr:ABC transporter ATP-binding protein [Corynebacterium mustelae]AKK07227.1 ABC-type antimicrobial peptide transport system, ATPase component [Corynebacterium mustelae]